MEDLNNSQIILLAILVSFVTSTATGIVTVTLMQEAPVSVTQTINRVVERTVEKVIPGDTQTVVREVSKVVNVDDLVVEAFRKASPAVVTIYTQSGTSTYVGFFVDGGATLVSAALPEGNYELRGADDTTIKLDVRGRDEASGLTVLTPLVPAGTDIRFSSLVFTTGTVSPGQSAVALSSGAGGDKTLAVGIITQVNGSTSTAQTIRTQAVTVNSLGGPLIDIKGDLIGVSVRDREAVSSYQLRRVIDSLK